MPVDQFALRNDRYFCESVALNDLAAAVGTPAYVYSQTMLDQNCNQLIAAFASYPTQACFAVKALSNLSILKRIFAAGLGADLVSGGELQRALLAGADPQRSVFSGVGKQPDEIRKAIQAGILMFNVESTSEIDMIASLAAECHKVVNIGLRINPNIDAQTNEKITTGLYSTKFGLAESDLPEILLQIKKHQNLKLISLGCHIGSQILDLNPLREAAERMVALATKVQQMGFPLQYLNMGGGLGIRYHDEIPPSTEAYAETLIDAIKHTGLKLIIEPGRSLVGNIGSIMTRVISVKKTPERHFVVVDAAMNDLIRPTLYESYHAVVNASLGIHELNQANSSAELCDIVGPICESGDYLAKDRLMPIPAAGDILLIRGCGAYSSSMASQYNSRPRAPEILVSGSQFRVIRQREALESLWAQELSGIAED